MVFVGNPNLKWIITGGNPIEKDTPHIMTIAAIRKNAGALSPNEICTVFVGKEMYRVCRALMNLVAIQIQI